MHSCINDGLHQSLIVTKFVDEERRNKDAADVISFNDILDILVSIIDFRPEEIEILEVLVWRKKTLYDILCRMLIAHARGKSDASLLHSIYKNILRITLFLDKIIHHGDCHAEKTHKQ